MSNTPSVPFLTKIAQIFQIAGFSDLEVWEGCPEVFLVIQHFHAEIRASERYSETPIRVFFPKSKEGGDAATNKFGDVECRDYQVDKSWPISKVMRIILKKFNVTPEEAANFVLVSTRDFPLDVDKCLADYGLGSLFRSWQVKLAPKSEIEAIMAARKKEALESKKAPAPPRPKKSKPTTSTASASDPLSGSSETKTKTKIKKKLKKLVSSEKGEKSEKSEKSSKVPSLELKGASTASIDGKSSPRPDSGKKASKSTTSSTTPRTKSSLKLSGVVNAEEDSSDLPTPSPRHGSSQHLHHSHDRVDSKTGGDSKAPDSARAEEKKHSRLTSSSNKRTTSSTALSISTLSTSGTGSNSQSTEDTSTSESVDDKAPPVPEKKIGLKKKKKDSEKSETKKTKKSTKTVVAPSLSVSAAAKESARATAALLSGTNSGEKDLAATLPARAQYETLRPKSRTVPILLLIQQSELFNNVRVKAAHWSITMQIRRLIRMVLDRADLEQEKGQFVLCDLYGRVLHPMATLQTYGLDAKLGKWELSLVRRPEASEVTELESRPFASNYAWIKNKDVLPRLQLQEAKRIIIELDEKLYSIESRDIVTQYAAKCAEVDTLKSEIALLKESEKTMTQIFAGATEQLKTQSSASDAPVSLSVDVIVEEIKASKKLAAEAVKSYEDVLAAKTSLQKELDAERASKQADVNKLVQSHTSEISTLSEYSDALFAKNSELVSEMEQLNSEIFDQRRRAKATEREKDAAKLEALETQALLEQHELQHAAEREQMAKTVEALTLQLAQLKERHSHTLTLLTNASSNNTTTIPANAAASNTAHLFASLPALDVQPTAKPNDPLSASSVLPSLHENDEENAENVDSEQKRSADGSLNNSDGASAYLANPPTSNQNNNSSNEVSSLNTEEAASSETNEDGNAENSGTAQSSPRDAVALSYQASLVPTGSNNLEEQNQSADPTTTDADTIANSSKVAAAPVPPPPPPPAPPAPPASLSESQEPGESTSKGAASTSGSKKIATSALSKEVDDGASLQEQIDALKGKLKKAPERVPPQQSQRNKMLDAIAGFHKDRLRKAGPIVKREKEPDHLAKALLKRFVAMADMVDVETLDDDDDDDWGTPAASQTPASGASATTNDASNTASTQTPSKDPTTTSSDGTAKDAKNGSSDSAPPSAPPAPAEKPKDSLYEDLFAADIFEEESDSEDEDDDESSSDDETDSFASALSRSASQYTVADEDDDEESSSEEEDEESETDE